MVALFTKKSCSFKKHKTSLGNKTCFAHQTMLRNQECAKTLVHLPRERTLKADSFRVILKESPSGEPLWVCSPNPGIPMREPPGRFVGPVPRRAAVPPRSETAGGDWKVEGPRMNTP